MYLRSAAHSAMVRLVDILVYRKVDFTGSCRNIR
jgi:hypothetical protein